MEEEAIIFHWKHQVMREDRLGGVTKVARAEEEERLARLARLQQEELPGFDLLLNLISSSSLPCCCIAFGILHVYFQGGRG